MDSMDSNNFNIPVKVGPRSIHLGRNRPFPVIQAREPCLLPTARFRFTRSAVDTNLLKKKKGKKQKKNSEISMPLIFPFPSFFLSFFLRIVERRAIETMGVG